MKKKLLYLMIAGLSLFTCPRVMKAETGSSASIKNEAAIEPGSLLALENKMREHKIPHAIFHKKQESNKESSAKSDYGYTVVYISGTGILLLIILLILLL